MKLAMVIILATVIFALQLKKVVNELKAHPAAEDRRELQTYPLLFAEIFCYVVFVVKTIQLAVTGVIPLL